MNRGDLACLIMAMGVMSCTFDASTQRAAGDASVNVVPAIDADPDVPDSGSSDPVDAALPCSEFVSAHFNACLLGTPSAGIDLSNVGTYIYNTDDGTLEDPDGQFVAHQSEVVDVDGVSTRVVSLESLTVGTDVVLRGRGSLPLIVASWSTIEIAGVLNFESRRGNPSGAGADPTSCSANGAVAGVSDTSGGGGGGGGGFGGSGGAGGAGDSDNSPSAGGAGGISLVDPPAGVRGGCPGAVGGDGLSSAGGASAGGGAIQLTAKSRIAITGAISAGGAGGQGGPKDSRAGGSGGGSGGYIGLQAPEIELAPTTRLTANGGGGGEGTSSSRTGDSGEDARRSESPAAGGGGNSDFGTDGGQGGAGLTLSGESVTTSLASGGGGGGGGVGYVLLRSPDLMTNGALLSPAATSL